MSDITLVADIGATNARFAISGHDTCLDKIQVLSCVDYADPQAAIDYYLTHHNIPKIDNLCFAIAGPIVGDVVKVTNNHWAFDREELITRYQLNCVSFLNDFEAIAYSIPQLSSEQLHRIGQPDILSTQGENFTYAILGAGSGLGVASLLKRNDEVFPIVTEGGHVNFSPNDDLQLAIFTLLKEKYVNVSNEMFLSGPGIVNIYNSICDIEQKDKLFQTAESICDAANKQADESSIKTLAVFFEVLAQVAGDLALTFKAFDGVFIAGGIVPRYINLIDHKRFREVFKNKSQHAKWLDLTPVVVVTETYPGLIGASYYAKNNLTRHRSTKHK